MTETEFRVQATRWMSPAALDLWIDRKIPAFGGMTPRERAAQISWDWVLGWMESLFDTIGWVTA